MERELLRLGCSGPAVAELHSRLVTLGYGVKATADIFDDATLESVQHFQRHRGLDPDGLCGPATWHSLVEAALSLGDRLIVLSAPLMRGDDVAELQIRLGSLGFDAGKTDGFFGPNTQGALIEFQTNVGLVADGVCGPDVVDRLRRYGSRGGIQSIAGIKEREQARTLTSVVNGFRMAVVYADDYNPLAGRIANDLFTVGCEATVVNHSDWSEIAQICNRSSVSLVVAVQISDEPSCEISYFAQEGFESYRGRDLASRLRKELPHIPSLGTCIVTGKRLPILRETQAPTVRLRLGPLSEVTENATELSAGIHRATLQWIAGDAAPTTTNAHAPAPAPL